MTSPEPGPLLSALQLIERIKVRRAIFGTFALSLSFFESYVLSRLRRAGCQDVAVYVDAEGYRASLMERRSRAVGQDYDLVPVSQSPHIFHPKFCYLWGDTDDFLLVGSGNLTFGGYGKNVEVLEMLTPASAPRAFIDFAEFLGALRLSSRVRLENTSMLAQFAERARTKGSPAGSDTVRIIHTLQESALDQLVRFAASEAPISELLVLSPYHHPQGEPIRRLAVALNVERLFVGTDANGEESSFPFAATSNWPVVPTPIQPMVEEPSRPLHAKWFELRGRRTLAMTGSVNATLESLCSTHNTELAVVRRLSEPTTCWASCEQPTYKPSVFPKSGSGQELVAYARLTRSARVEGRILGQHDVQGIWKARLESVADESAYPEVVVDAESQFSFACDPASLTDTGGMQIVLTRDAVRARGWVAVEQLLGLSSRAKAAARALAKMLSREDTAEDTQAFIDFLSIHLQRATKVLPRAPLDVSPIETDEDAELRVAVELLFPDDGYEQAGQAGNALHRNPLAALEAIARALLRGTAPGRKTKGLPTGGGPRKGGGAEDKEDDRKQKAQEDLVKKFNKDLEDAIDRRDGNQPARNLATVLVVWLAANLDLQLLRIGAPDQAWQFCERWFRRVFHERLQTGLSAELDAAVCGVAAALAMRCATVEVHGIETYRLTLRPQLIREWLDTFFGDALLTDEIQQHAADWLALDTARALVDNDTERPLKALSAVLALKTRRHLLSAALETRDQGLLKGAMNDFAPEEVEWLGSALGSGIKQPSYSIIADPTSKGCPRCNIALINDVRGRLHSRRIAQCINCKTVLLWLKP